MLWQAWQLSCLDFSNFPQPVKKLKPAGRISIYLLAGNIYFGRSIKDCHACDFASDTPMSVTHKSGHNLTVSHHLVVAVESFITVFVIRTIIFQSTNKISENNIFHPYRVFKSLHLKSSKMFCHFEASLVAPLPAGGLLSFFLCITAGGLGLLIREVLGGLSV